jgi:hypothetical protein
VLLLVVLVVRVLVLVLHLREGERKREMRSRSTDKRELLVPVLPSPSMISPDTAAGAGADG